MDLIKLARSALQKHSPEERKPLRTPWEAADAVKLHPHPQFARNTYTMLDGIWDFAIVGAESMEKASASWMSAPHPTAFGRTIRIPYSPECALSGVEARIEPSDLLWYRRSFDLDSFSNDASDSRYLLHFDAVDWACAVYVDGVSVGSHRGGYLPFCYDITDALNSGKPSHIIEVCAWDPSDEGSQLRGKQALKPHGMWYPAQSGIWQSVWLEQVPNERIAALGITADPDTKTISLDLALLLDGRSSSTIDIDVEFEGEPVASASFDLKQTAATVDAETAALIRHWPLDPGVDGDVFPSRFELPLESVRQWSPDDPSIYHVRARFGEDTVSTYCAFRTTSIETDGNGFARFCLNHKPLFLEGLLDQGYWPDGLMTAPSLEAMQFDIAYAQACGFNMLRKHVKVESDRWYYLCDVAGMLVWQDVPSGGRGWNEQDVCNLPTVFASRWTLEDGVANYARLNADDDAYRREWLDTMEGMILYLKNHPCIATWVLFNEGWGQFDSVLATQRARVLDDSRPIDAASGWFDQGAGDFTSEHNYFRSLKLRPKRFKTTGNRAYVISEFGGAVFYIPGHSSCENVYGYGRAKTMSEWNRDLEKLRCDARSLGAKGLSGYVLTQLSDVEEETNGLMTYDRKVLKCVQEPAE